ncbi:hypothetical protein VPJ68_06255, partial [Parabacteroides distasonis]
MRTGGYGLGLIAYIGLFYLVVETGRAPARQRRVVVKLGVSWGEAGPAPAVDRGRSEAIGWRAG